MFDRISPTERARDIQRNPEIDWLIVIYFFGFLGFGLIYSSKVLVLIGVVLMCSYVALQVHVRTQSKRSTVLVLTVLAVIIIQVGLKWEKSASENLIYEVSSECFEFRLLQVYFSNWLIYS